MKSTYEIIKALPGKGTDWRKLVDALQAHYLAVYAQSHNGAAPWPGNTTDVWNAAKGVRELRGAAMEIACASVHQKAMRSKFIPPSEETLSWGGFLGGETFVWTDHDAESDETLRIAEIIERIIGDK